MKNQSLIVKSLYVAGGIIILCFLLSFFYYDSSCEFPRILSRGVPFLLLIPLLVMLCVKKWRKNSIWLVAIALGIFFGSLTFDYNPFRKVICKKAVQAAIDSFTSEYKYWDSIVGEIDKVGKAKGFFKVQEVNYNIASAKFKEDQEEKEAKFYLSFSGNFIRKVEIEKTYNALYTGVSDLELQALRHLNKYSKIDNRISEILGIDVYSDQELIEFGAENVRNFLKCVVNINITSKILKEINGYDLGSAARIYLTFDNSVCRLHNPRIALFDAGNFKKSKKAKINETLPMGRKMVNAYFDNFNLNSYYTLVTYDEIEDINFVCNYILKNSPDDFSYSDLTERDIKLSRDMGAVQGISKNENLTNNEKKESLKDIKATMQSDLINAYYYELIMNKSRVQEYILFLSEF